MRKLIIDGVEWFENKFGVRFRYGEEDALKGLVIIEKDGSQREENIK